MTDPTTQLILTTRLDRGLAWHRGNSVRHLLIEIGAEGATMMKQPPRPLNLALVLDTSGSMAGGKLEAAKQAAAEVIRQLHDDDSLSLVSFDSDVVVPTTFDVWLFGRTRVAVEAKFTELEFGTCSRVKLEHADPKRCSGAYRVQSGRQHRCALAERGIWYWDLVPDLFAWDGQRDHDPCPLRSTYQLVRNVLAARAEAARGNDDDAHVLVVYDARHPAFQPGGAADSQWREATDALKERRRLRRVSWQGLLGHLARDPDLRPLTAEIDRKYGLGRGLH